MQQLPFDIPTSTSLSSENFLVMPSNQSAKAWVDKDSLVSKGMGFVIFGAAGCGKTHLAHIWQQKMKKKSIFFSCPIKQDIDIQKTFIKKAVIIDDFAGGYSAEEEKQFFHIYNTIKSSGGSLLITSQVPPKQWKVNLPDLKSRLLSLPAVEIHEPEDVLLTAIFVKLLHDRQLVIEESVIRFVIARIERSGKSLEKAVEILDNKSLQTGKRITLPFVKEALKNILK